VERTFAEAVVNAQVAPRAVIAVSSRTAPFFTPFKAICSSMAVARLKLKTNI